VEHKGKIKELSYTTDTKSAFFHHDILPTHYLDDQIHSIPFFNQFFPDYESQPLDITSKNNELYSYSNSYFLFDN
jgi:hypothetical protein